MTRPRMTSTTAPTAAQPSTVSPLVTNAYLTPAMLAERWHMSTGHLANLRSEGRGLTFVKFGHRVLYRLEDVQAYEAAHVVSPIGA